ncbi:MAG: hypothetical protein WBH14_07760 [Albidovulum sp.]
MMKSSVPPDMRRTAAILTGDLIGSTKLDPALTDRAMAVLEGAAASLPDWPQTTNPQFTRFRGDGWQALVYPTKYALRAILFLKASLAAADTGLSTRVAIGLGQISDTGSGGLGGAHGSAFKASGRALDAMKRGEDMVIDGAGASGLHKAIVALVAAKARRWSREQAEAMCHALPPAAPTLATIATQIGISQQAVSYRLKAAGHNEIDEALKAWENDADTSSGAAL